MPLDKEQLRKAQDAALLAKYEAVGNEPPPAPKHSQATAGVMVGLILLVIFAAAYLLENPGRRAAIAKRFTATRLDGPHRAFVVVAGLWAVLGPYFVPAWQRPTVIRSWIGWTLWDLIPRNDAAQTLAFFGLPALVLYVTAFLLAPPVFHWVRGGFTKQEP